jgi:hypothetical protein
MPQDTGGILNLKKPVGSDDIRLQTIGIDLPYNFQKIDDAFTAHLAESAQKHITESGENANGRYIRFDDGTQICMDLDRTFENIEPETSTIQGLTLYRSAGYLEWQFPATFVSNPYVKLGDAYVSRNNSSVLFFSSRYSALSVTRVTFQIVALASFDKVLCSRFAIGRWK